MSLSVEIRLARPGFDLDAAFTVPAGVTSLFGPSGAGKTTLIQIVAGLVRPDRGRIALSETVLTDTGRGLFVPVHRRGIAIVFQDGRLFPHLSVRQNLRYGTWFTRGGGGDFGRIVGLLGIGALLDRRPANLSGGERSRVAIGRALMTRPRLLILDEPLASLDRARAEEILPYLEGLRDEVGLPILHVSHAIEEVVRLADHLVLLDRGRVTAFGPLAEILSRIDGTPPGGERGAVIEAQVVGLDAAYHLARLGFDGGEFRLPDTGLVLGQRVRLHIRAGDVAVAVGKPDGLSILNALPALIEASRPSLDAAVELDLAVGPTRLVARVTRLSADSLGLVPGRSVYALVKSIALDRGRVLPMA